MALAFYQRGVLPRETGTPSYPAGKFGEGLASALAAETNIDLDAVIGSGTNIGDAAATVEGWVNTTQAGSLRVLLSNGAWYWIAHNDSGQLIATYGTGGGVVTLNSSSVVNDGNWHHIALVFNAPGASLYCDGTRVATNSLSATQRNDSIRRFAIGGLYTPESFDATATFDDVRISSVKRYTASTYTVPTARFTSDASTVALYNFDTAPPPEDIPVTATAPTKNDAAGTSEDTYTIPTKAGVEYRVGGVAKSAGTYSTGGASSVTVTANALTGYVLSGTSSWTLTFSTGGGEPDPDPDPDVRLRLAFEPLVWNGSGYPARHPGAASVTYIGPNQPGDWQNNDLWVRNT